MHVRFRRIVRADNSLDFFQVGISSGAERSGWNAWYFEARDHRQALLCDVSLRFLMASTVVLAFLVWKEETIKLAGESWHTGRWTGDPSKTNNIIKKCGF